MVRFLVTNDDSYASPGLYLLYRVASAIGEAVVFSTESPRSVIGHTITFSRPLRVYSMKIGNVDVYLTDGTPVDVIHLALDVLKYRPDLVLSGINVGENLTLQHIFYSGTVAAAIESAVAGIPAIAFSADVESFDEISAPKMENIAMKYLRTIVEKVAVRGLPPGVDLLSVNIPNPENFRGCVRVVRASRVRWHSSYDGRRDPAGRPYYWLYMKKLESEVGTDVHAVEVEGCISVTPLTIDLNAGRLSIEEVERILTT
ncbi:MAG: 5'/3'-nucleotidase SurE [Sulfolobales archaeon]|nr:5'/3'-nucleotidase SurE [Sulfolobales archaeon]MCX8208512.1 5'/3'-nucleotidase SurE [Sulfolobales archaeon]MDW8010576.1 5'/3'-nucleotidase SurE [Sulfolobales archaeon]